MSSVFTVLRATQLEADRVRDECEQGLRQDLGDNPELLAYSIERLWQMHQRYKKRIAKLAR
jgi:hypothetical protein